MQYFSNYNILFNLFVLGFHHVGSWDDVIIQDNCRSTLCFRSVYVYSLLHLIVLLLQLEAPITNHYYSILFVRSVCFCGFLCILFCCVLWLRRNRTKYAQYKKYTNHQYAVRTKKKLYCRIRNGIIKLGGGGVIAVYKVQQFHQNNFNAPDDGRLARNRSWKWDK
jgi:hypothetical protein